MLAGIDLRIEQPASTSPVTAAPVSAEADAAVICPHADCAQSNPAGSSHCLYCDRPLQSKAPASLINLPSALSHRYHITAPMPAKGAEAELLLVQANHGGPQLVAKIYRHGILPKTAVQDRIALVGKEHRVDILEWGVSDGYAYELMEYCSGGSLRSLLDQPVYQTDNQQGMPAELVRALSAELSLALADTHAHGLVHRDLKPENILIRSMTPLDLVLTDFGIASILDVTQRYTGVAHTLPYAAPESLSGVIDAKADYWALGMIVLEAATGAHPFKNLSDAVILHTLTTRNIVTSGIRDAAISKLARGLLIRDPAQRWGATEVQRWLANDPTLAEPLHSLPEADQAYSQPYHLGEQRCYQPEQLGVALANQWELGITDVLNGQLLAWFRDVQKDQNVVRLLLDQRSAPGNSVDLQLLTLILHLAPGIPPVWQGQSIALTAILKHVSEAMKGDDKSTQWLNQLYQYKVLEIYARAGNQNAAEIVQRWNKTCDRFVPAWEEKNALLASKSTAPDAAVNIDQLMYGNTRLNRPYLSALHARILAFCYDSRWAQRKRQSVQTELTRLAVQCPWLTELGDPATMPHVELLATECLLPEIQKIADRQTKQDMHTRAQLDDDVQSLKKNISSITAQIHGLLRGSALNAADCEILLGLCTDYFSDIAAIRASGRSDPAWIELRKSALRQERKIHNLIQKINQLTEHQAVNSGWFNQNAMGYAIFLTVLLLTSLSEFGGSQGTKWMVLLLMVVGLFFTWRFLPVLRRKREIRDLARTL